MNHDEAVGADAEKVEQSLDAALRALPRDVLGELRREVICAHHDEIVALIETIRLTAPDVATALRRMADLFDYDGLRNCIDR